MMRKTIHVLVVLCVVVFMTGMACGAQQGTSKEAQDMVNAAVSYLKSNSPEKAYAVFNAKSGKFGNKDLYIFVVDFNGMTLAHGGNNALVGKSMKDLRDPDGKFFIKEMIELARSKGNGWVDYKWPNPITKKIETKTTYIQRAGDLFLGCGIYK
jgi:cytochrome c